MKDRPKPVWFHGASWIAVAVLSTTLAVCQPARGDDFDASSAATIKKVVPTVVSLTVLKGQPPDTAAPDTRTAGAQAGNSGADFRSFVASGFVIDPSGVIVTNFHVVENAAQITVMFSDGTVLPGKTLSADNFADIALVKVNPAHPLPAAHWGDSHKLELGDQVFAAGNPFGLGLSISAGIISALNRDIQNSPYDDYIQTDAPINHGNSGGPLFNMRGDVMGVDSDIISPTPGSSGVGFALPSNTARFVVDRLRTYGWVRPSWIGVKVQQMKPAMADALGLPQPEGSIVAWVLPNGPAEKAGLDIGDIIVDFNGKRPTDERALLRDIAEAPVGDKITLTVLRDDAKRDIAITTEEWPRNQWDRRDTPVNVTNPKLVIPPDLGLSLSAVPESQRAAVGLANGLTGVMITNVLPDSDAARRGVVRGDVILRVQNKPVASSADVMAALASARAADHAFVLMLILPTVRANPGPEWYALGLGPALK